MEKIAVSLRNVSKSFTTKKLGTVKAVDNFNLDIYEGECFAFLGPSGCGKTTTLRMLAGFEDLSEGEIYLDGKPVSVKSKKQYVPPEDRGLGMVFQAFAVWPHMNVFENVAFPLKLSKMPKAQIKEKVSQALKHTGLSGLEEIYPSELSGGQQQRIALARAIVTRPKIMLLDEPLSNLDPHLRESMRFEIKELQKKFNFTIIFVTHDQAEAMALADRMLVMDMGKIQQIGTAADLYDRPESKFVHSFLGDSCFVKVELKMEEHGEEFLAIKGSDDVLNIKLNEEIKNKFHKSSKYALMALRPNKIRFAKENEVGVSGKIIKRTVLTANMEYLIQVGDELIKLQSSHNEIYRDNDLCYLKFYDPMWYEYDGENHNEEREKRQLI